MDAERISVVESGVLTASDEQWELARSRFIILAPLAGLGTVGFTAADEAAERLQLSRRQYAHDLRMIWECVDDRPPRALTRPFEYLNRADQTRILAGAAAAITLIEEGTITAFGTHGDLLSPYPADPVFAGTPFPPSVPVPMSQADTASSAWERLPALIDAVIDAARENADTARSLYAFILLGAHTDQQIRRIDDTFNELGIDIGNHDR